MPAQKGDGMTPSRIQGIVFEALSEYFLFLIIEILINGKMIGPMKEKNRRENRMRFQKKKPSRTVSSAM